MHAKTDASFLLAYLAALAETCLGQQRCVQYQFGSQVPLHDLLDDNNTLQLRTYNNLNSNEST